MKRRDFLKKATTPGSYEEQALLARADDPPQTADNPAAPDPMPQGKLGDLTVSRLICGGNLISGFAHSRDLIYVSRLVQNYFSEDKILETLELAEHHGINTAILRYDERTIKVITRYWRENRGNLQWIAQIKPRENDLVSDARRAADLGACATYVQGETGDAFWKNNRMDLLAKSLDAIRTTGVVAGIGAHRIEPLQACVKEKIQPDFYMKTFNSKGYWSSSIAERHDSVFEETPVETAAFFAKCDTPWIAFKVLGAGAIPPAEGFRYAFEKGADFICVGMFDFQIAEDAKLAREIVAGVKRERPWKA